MGDTKKRNLTSKLRPNQLMQSLMKGTARLQKMLSENLDILEDCTSIVKSRNLALTILDLYDKGSHLSSVITVLGKLNDELVFCRMKASKIKDAKKRPFSLASQRLCRLEHTIAAIIGENLPENWDNFLQPPQQVLAPPRSDSRSLPSRAQKSPTKSVTLLAPSIDARQADTFTHYGDMSDTYWSTGHHKFMQFPDEDWYNVIQENNLSYQKLHLVAPANFVSPTTVEYISSTAIPWLTQQDVSLQNFDILRDELERVLRRTRKLQDRVWQAASLSVKFAEPKVQRKMSQSWPRRESYRGIESVRSDLTGTVASTAHHLSSLKSVSLSPGAAPWSAQKEIERERLTRVNIFDKYPHVFTKWTGAAPNPVTCLAQRDVSNQGSLYNQTKLKLFLPQREKKGAAVKRDLITPDSVFSSQSFRGMGSSTRLVSKLLSRGGDTTLSRLRKNRLDDLVNIGLKSDIVADRIDAAVSLLHLGSADNSMTVPALLRTASEDPDSVVRYQASKALLNLGVCPTSAVKEFTYQLRVGHSEVVIDALESMSSAQNMKSLLSESQDAEAQGNLVREVRRHAMLSESDSEKTAFLAAACLVELCDSEDIESSEIALGTLKYVALFSEGQDTRAKSLEVLVRKLDMCDGPLFSTILHNLKTAIKWRNRLSAALLIAFLGAGKVSELVDEETIYEILQRKVWDDPKREVRLGVSHAATALGLRPRLLEDLDKFLRDSSEEMRSCSVIAMSAVGIHSDATLRFLVEMLDLDASDYVRLQIIRTFQDLGLNDFRAVRAAREREKVGGPLATAAQKYLSQLGNLVITPKTPRRQRHSANASRREATPSTLSAKVTPKYLTGVSNPVVKQTQQDSNSRGQDAANKENQRLSITSTAIRKSAKLSPGKHITLETSRGEIFVI